MRVDSNPYPGVSYYRLSQTDLDGTREYYSVQASYCFGNTVFSVYPNPIGNKFEVRLNQSGAITVYNEMGQIVLNQAIVPGSNSIRSESLANGIYLAIVKMNNGKTESKKLVKF